MHYNLIVEDIEDGIEKHYRNLVADDIDSCLRSAYSESLQEAQQVYWFNQGLRFASIIARWGIGNDNR